MLNTHTGSIREDHIMTSSQQHKRDAALLDQLEFKLLVLSTTDFFAPTYTGLGEISSPLLTFAGSAITRTPITYQQARLRLSDHANDSRVRKVRLKLSLGDFSLPLGWRLSKFSQGLIKLQM
jgi:hypothetical protein